MDNYAKFLERKTQLDGEFGFDPVFMPDYLFDFQKALVQWAVKKGRAAIFADCGLGKTPMQLVWAQNVIQKENKPVLILTPLAVSIQTKREADKFGIECKRIQDGKVDGFTGVAVTNYERLHYFNPEDFSGVVCDESSILKHFTGATQQQVTRFMCKFPYRLLCTATAAPNDYIELGTSSEALGGLTHSDMLTRFFKQLDDKGQKKEMRKLEDKERFANHFGKLAYRVSQTIGQWRLKHHAEEGFWKWVCSWARACRKPSDLGFSDNGFILPPLNERDHIIHPHTAPDGFLFTLPSVGLKEEREERRRTLPERVELVRSLTDHESPVVVWCHLNQEGDSLEQALPGARQIKGATPDDEKEEIYEAFAKGNLRVLVIKPKIGAWGLNWQHCSNVVTFATHSYEQYYQAVRRCWRFGQKKPVKVDVVYTQGEVGVRKNMERKKSQADAMFSELVKHMGQAQGIKRINEYTNKMEVPSWL